MFSILRRIRVIRLIPTPSKSIDACRGFSSFGSTESQYVAILKQVQDGSISPETASRLIIEGSSSNESTLDSFANLDHDRGKRTGFPEAVFAEGKTVGHVASILDEMARKSIERGVDTANGNAILATRVDSKMYDELAKYKFEHGTIQYDSVARIVSMNCNTNSDVTPRTRGRIIVCTAGTTDIPVAAEAAVTLQRAGCEVECIYDVGVAGLHRIVKALPKLTHPDVGCVIVVAGMDGALPSVVGGLVSTPVIAVPTSIGYGASFGGISALLTMLNSCAPGVGVVNINNGFGAAALAYKCISQTSD